MDKPNKYYQKRDDRLIRYAGRKLDPERWIVLRADPEYVSTYEGQVAAITAANLFSQLSPSVAMDFPRVRIVSPLPWEGQELREFVLATCFKSDPHGRFCVRPFRGGDYLVHLGPSGAKQIVHGAGWFSYTGPAPSPLQKIKLLNPIGPAMAAIAAASHVFVGNFPSKWPSCRLNAFNWSPKYEGINLIPNENQSLGDVWFVGTGSVGTAILYFLTLFTRNFSPTLFDMDRVKLLNITRSPIFIESHVGQPKVDATKSYLQSCGMNEIKTENLKLHESPIWKNRNIGTPDLLVPAANEFNVRHQIESLYPPVQIYGTTGKNWQASVIRHIPNLDPCSCCIFPSKEYAPTDCAVDQEILVSSENGSQVDASLPFLSFAAGLMAAAEILKVSLPGYPFTPNRAFLTTRPEPRFVAADLIYRSDCICRVRDLSIYKEILS